MMNDLINDNDNNDGVVTTTVMALIIPITTIS